jgi:DNA modification methylase
MDKIELLHGDCLDLLPTLDAESVQCVVTSPPYYGLRDYKEDGQIGLEKSPEEYVAALNTVFRQIHRVLKPDGVAFLNLGDSYVGYKGGKYCVNQASSRLKQNSHVPKAHDRVTPHTTGLAQKQLMGIPWRVAFALQADGWYLRQEIIWHKNNPMPESVKDRCTKSHEQVFLLSKNARYFWNYEANMEEAAYDGRKDCQMKGSAKYEGVDIPGAKANSFHVGGHTRWTFKDGKAYRNRRSVWSIPTKPSREAHFAMMPPRLAELCILAGSRPGDVILDPFAGAGTTGMVARQLQRRFIGIELSKESCQIAHRRIYAEPKQAKAKTVRGKYKDALTPSDLFAQQKLW